MLNDLRIGTRLALGFGAVIVMQLLSILTGSNAMNNVMNGLDAITQVENVRDQKCYRLEHIIDEINNATQDILLLSNLAEKDAAIARIDELQKEYDQTMAAYKNLLEKDEPELFAALAKEESLYKRMKKSDDGIIRLIKRDKGDAAFESWEKEARPLRAALVASWDEIMKIEMGRTVRIVDQTEKAFSGDRMVLLSVGMITLLLSAGLALILTRSITKPLAVATELIVSRDLTKDLSAYKRGDNEIGVMIRAFSNLSETLRGQLKEILSGVTTLTSSSSQILAATTQVASGTNETATAISETSTTVEEVRQASQLSLQKAKNVSDGSQRVAAIALSGRKAVEESGAGMRQISAQMQSVAGTIVRLSEQSQSIGGIIAAVTDLADQSNLLAVNAAIEAARAGEQGKGFAVVAQEIKSLAEQSKQATAQVRGILSDVQKATSAAVMATEQGGKAVESGLKQAAAAGDAIEKLAESSQEAAQSAVQIVVSSQQQQQGMEQIGKAMENINQAGAQTAASMKQAAAATQNLHDLGEKLKGLVEQYKI